MQAGICGTIRCLLIKCACLLWMNLMAKKKSKREYVWLECSKCKDRNYRTSVSVAEGMPKLNLKKFCKREREHTVHKIRRK